MKIALIGYGKMGRIIEQIALKRGHRVVSKIDINNTEDFESGAFASADVAIEFTTPATAFENYRKCFAAGIPVVSGTTGWTERMQEIRKICQDEGQTFFYASNFSIGVNIFFAVNRYLAEQMNGFPSYEVMVTEIHHKDKLDAPSGTAITLANDIGRILSRKERWQTASDAAHGDVIVQSIRRGDTPGTHEVCYESDIDTLTIRHEAKSREGFALGAVIAAEFTAGKKGFLTMDDLLATNCF